MTIRLHVAVASVAAAAALAAIIPARAGGDKIAFPDKHEAGVLFVTLDRPDNKQFREFYASQRRLSSRRNGVSGAWMRFHPPVATNSASARSRAGPTRP